MREIEKLTEQDRKDLELPAGKSTTLRKATAKALRIIDAQGTRISWLESKLDLWRCPVHGDFVSYSAYDGDGHALNGKDDCGLRCERVGGHDPQTS